VCVCFYVLVHVREMRHGIQVRGDEFAARILIDAQLHTQQTHYCSFWYLHVCMYVCMCMCVYMYINMCVCLHVLAYICWMRHGIQVRGNEFAAQILVDAQLPTQQTHYCAYWCVCVWMYVCIYVYKFVCMYIYVYINQMSHGIEVCRNELEAQILVDAQPLTQ